MSYQSKFSDCLRETMSKKSISQATVSRLTGLDDSTIARVFNGKRKNIAYETVATIAEKLHMWRGRTPEDLVKYIEKLESKLVDANNKLYKDSLLITLLLILDLGLTVCLILK